MAEISILIVGDTSRREFRGARGALDELGGTLGAADVESAEAVLAGGRMVPDLIVIAQSHPEQFSSKAVGRLRRLAPLARVLGLLGSWCEGEVRSGKPWPAAVRVYWHQWLPRCGRELARLGEGLCPTWGLPATATEEERLLAGAERPAGRADGLIAISAWQFEMHQWLSAACRSRGYSTEWLRPHFKAHAEGAAAAIFDGTECRGEELGELRRLSAAVSPAPVIALLHFPRVDDRDRALSAGASAVMSKPLLIEDLFWELDRLAG